MPGVGQSYHGAGDRIRAPAAALPMADQISPDALEARIRLVDERRPESGSEMSRGGSGRAGTAPSGGRVRR
jgi:hypothetical protein